MLPACYPASKRPASIYKDGETATHMLMDSACRSGVNEASCVCLCVCVTSTQTHFFFLKRQKIGMQKMSTFKSKLHETM